jgi:serine protease AprX
MISGFIRMRFSNPFSGVQVRGYALFIQVACVLLMTSFHMPLLHAEKYILYLDAKPQDQLPALSARALERRKAQGIDLDDRDLPVSSLRLQELQQCNALTLLGHSRWLNAAWIETELSTEALLALFPWHTGIEITLKLKKNPAQYGAADLTMLAPNAIANDFGFAGQQNNQIGLACLHSDGFRGEDVIISVFDSGFRNVDQISAFDSMRLQNRLLHTRDFVDNDMDVFDDDSHGTFVLSTMAARRPMLYSGASWKSSYILVRTETIFSETPAEEFNWLMAMEWVDSIGTDVIQSSLGYNYFDGGTGSYTYSDLDGRTAVISRAAATAVSRGIMVVVSAGNEGSNSWGYITVPADADSILAVGSVSFDGNRSGFSSYGPTSDGRIKPDVMARGEGTSVFGTSGAITSSSGTSFAAPLIAGMAACLRQAHPQVPAWYLMDVVRLTADRASQPNNLYGYGIANACAADSMLQLYTSTQAQAPESRSLHVYPNPTRDYLNISIPEAASPATWMIFNSSGQLLNKGYDVQQRISVQHLLPGVYFIKVHIGNTYYVQQWIKS